MEVEGILVGCWVRVEGEWSSVGHSLGRCKHPPYLYKQMSFNVWRLVRSIVLLVFWCPGVLVFGAEQGAHGADPQGLPAPKPPLEV